MASHNSSISSRRGKRMSGAMDEESSNMLRDLEMIEKEVTDTYSRRPKSRPASVYVGSGITRIAQSSEDGVPGADSLHRDSRSGGHGRRTSYAKESTLKQSAPDLSSQKSTGSTEPKSSSRLFSFTKLIDAATHKKPESSKKATSLRLKRMTFGGSEKVQRPALRLEGIPPQGGALPSPAGKNKGPPSKEDCPVESRFAATNSASGSTSLSLTPASGPTIGAEPSVTHHSLPSAHHTASAVIPAASFLDARESFNAQKSCFLSESGERQMRTPQKKPSVASLISSKLANLKGSKSTLEKEIARLVSEKEQAVERVAKLNNLVADLQAKLREHEQTIRDFEQKAAKTDEKTDEASPKSAVQEPPANGQYCPDATNATIDSLEKQLGKLQIQLEKEQEHRLQKEQAHKEHQGRQEEIVRDLEDKLMELTNGKLKLEKQLNKKETELEQFHRRIVELEGRLTEEKNSQRNSQPLSIGRAGGAGAEALAKVRTEYEAEIAQIRAHVRELNERLER